MKPTEQTCDPQRIDDYLDERLSEALASEFERHLCDCERCRNELQQRSAEPNIWRDAVALLGPDSAPPDSTPAPLRGSVRSYGNDCSGSGEQTIDEHRNSQRERYVLSVLDSLTPTDDPEMLGRVGDYEISGVVGVGGMGAVLKGFDKSLRRVVAIKVMAPHLAHSGSARTRFQREARAAAAITHDNVIDIYAVSEAAGLPYLVMPYARGPSLQKRIDEGGPLGVVEVVRIGRQIAAGLSAAHEQGVVHRDIKPANILLSDGIERLWITDFGVARAMDDASMTQTGVIAGTPQYMSPEQARGESVDHRSDLFSLGSVLYTACTGRPPFRSEAAYGILRRITDSEPRPIREINADIPEWLCIIIARLLAKHPADRFENAAEVVDLLDGCLAHLQQPLQVELPPSLRGKPAVDVMRSALDVVITRREPELQPAQQIQLTQPSLQSRRLFPKRVFIMIGSIFLAGLLGLLGMQLTSPTDISGHWTGENWQHVSLASVDEASDWYLGTFVDTAGRRGALRLEWSRLQRRYNGRWKVGEAEAGQITLRAGENGTLRGAVSVDPESQLEPNVPRLLEFAWQPASKEAQHNFESKSFDSINKPQIPSLQTDSRVVRIKSPWKGVVRFADGIKLNKRVKQGQILAEISPSGSDSIAQIRLQLTALQKKFETANAKVKAAELSLDSVKPQLAVNEGYVRTLETEQKGVAAAISAGLEPQAAGLEAQRKLDAAKLALKKAEADVVLATNSRNSALEERKNLEQELADLNLLEQKEKLTRRHFLAPIDGIIAFIPMLGDDIVQYGDVICEVTPDPSKPSESPVSQKNATATPTPSPAPALVAEPKLSSSVQSLSAFGPASELAKRIRAAQEKIAQNALSLEGRKSKLVAIEEKLNAFREKQSQASDDSSPQQVELAQQLKSVELEKQLMEKDIEVFNARRKTADVELAEAEREKQTIVQILQAKLSTTQRERGLKQEFSQLMRRRQQLQPRNVSLEELNQAEQGVAVAESEVRQLELLLKFYGSVGRD
jgi:serine/threonine protein kinase